MTLCHISTIVNSNKKFFDSVLNGTTVKEMPWMQKFEHASIPCSCLHRASMTFKHFIIRLMHKYVCT